GNDGAQLGGLGHDGGIGLQVFTQLHDTAKREFFVRGRYHPDLTLRLFRLCMHLGDRMHHSGQTCLRIAGTATIQPAVTDHRLEGRNRHSSNGCGVYMRLENDAPFSGTARQPRNKVGTTRKYFLSPGFDSMVEEKTFDVRNDLGFWIAMLVCRVDAVDA